RPASLADPYKPLRVASAFCWSMADLKPATREAPAAAPTATMPTLAALRAADAIAAPRLRPAFLPTPGIDAPRAAETPGARREVDGSMAMYAAPISTPAMSHLPQCTKKTRRLPGLLISSSCLARNPNPANRPSDPMAARRLYCRHRLCGQAACRDARQAWACLYAYRRRAANSRSPAGRQQQPRAGCSDPIRC